jgi:muramoyltetrapeptide carboxypeptidase
MAKPTRKPVLLSPGSTIAVVAPAGPVEHSRDVERGAAALERMGFKVRYEDRIFQSFRYLAGSDAERARELMRVLEDPGIHAVVAMRGGYGCSRLIGLLDPKRLRPHCKIFMGFSDLTTLHLYFRKKFGWVTFHGPMAASAVLSNDPESDELQHFLRILTDPDYLPVFAFPSLKTMMPGAATGELAGGCLSILTASLGTEFELTTEGKILFLEDLGEPPYRVDRMLTQLRLAGKFDRVAGIVLGDFSDSESQTPPCTLEETLEEVLGDLKVPAIARFPAGHGSENWVLPLGVKVRLDASNRTLACLEPATIRG